MTNMRTVMGSMDLDQFLSLSRRDQRPAASVVVDSAAASWGIKVTRIEIKDIVPPADLIALDGPPDEGRAREAGADPRGRGLSGSRQILRAEGEKQAQILQAEGQPRGGLPRCRGARTLCRGGGQGDRDWSSPRHRRGRRAGDQLFRGAGLYQGHRGARLGARTRRGADARPSTRPRCSARSAASPRSRAKPSAASPGSAAGSRAAAFGAAQRGEA